MSIASSESKKTEETPSEVARRLPEWPSLEVEHGPVPGDKGWPVLGNTIAFVRNTRELIDGLRQRHGANFWLRVFGTTVLIVGGPAEARELLLDRDKNFSSMMGWKVTLGALFKGGLMLRDFDEHAGPRRIAQVAFRSSAMQQYVATMTPMIERWVAGLPAQLACYPALKQLTLDLASQVFAGVALGAEADALKGAFTSLVAASVAVIKRDVPGLSFSRGLRARRELERFFRARLADRRSQHGGDMFSQLCHARSDEGEQFSDDDIVDQMIFLMMAAHDTTTSSLSTLVYALAREPSSQERVRAEILAHAPSGARRGDRDQLPLLDSCFNEALRLYPPVPFLGRRSVRACRVGTLHIPANTQIGISSLVTHRLAEHWPDPDRFDPERFTGTRGEALVKSPAYYPFGGGAHTCIGLHFARIQVQLVLQALLRRYRIELVKPAHHTRMSDVPIPFPRDGLPVRLSSIQG
jgi:cytochrome P450